MLNIAESAVSFYSEKYFSQCGYYAVTTASTRDLVVIAGKGAEDYMEERGIRRPYSDRSEVIEVLRSLNYE